MISLKKIFNSFRYAFQGIKFTFKEEQNMKIHVIITIAVIIVGFILGLSYLEWIAIIICIGMVFAAEIFNTAIENMVNLVSPERNPLAGKIKDLSAAAVVVCAAISIVVGCLIFIPKLFSIFI